MTDLISGPGTGQSNAVSPDVETAALPPVDGTAPMEWAPLEPAPKKRRLGLWIGLGAGALVAAAAAASLLLIAPGMTIAGVPVGFMTPGMATDAVSSRLAATEVRLTGAGDEARVGAGDLGASIDAAALADRAFADRPMWNLGTWLGEPIVAEVTLDADTADSALRAAVPSSYSPSTDATIVFDPAMGQYTATPAESGTGLSVDDLTTEFTSALSAGETSFEYSSAPVDVAPAITDEEAAATVTQLNEMLTRIGFYVGDERTVPVEPAVAASWLTVTAVEGELEITADTAKIQTTVDTLPAAVDRAPVPARTIVNSQGKVLGADVEGVAGRSLGATSGIAAAFAAALADGDAAYPLTVSEIPFENVTVARSLTVDISDQRTYLIENGEVVKSWRVSTGRAGTETDLGRFTVRAHVRMQDMKGRNADGTPYVTEDVPWVTYFNGDEAFHGTYWHSNFGTPMSHGCVNMPIDVAREIYNLAPLGLEVWVRA